MWSRDHLPAFFGLPNPSPVRWMRNPRRYRAYIAVLERFGRDSQSVQPAVANEKALSLERSERGCDRFPRRADRLPEELVRERQLHPNAPGDDGAVPAREL